LDYQGHQAAPSTASQTAWALLGLMAAGEVRHGAVTRGVDYLLRNHGTDGFWPELQFTATGFPRVFYLRYHGYAKFFPVWALARGATGIISFGVAGGLAEDMVSGTRLVARAIVTSTMRWPCDAAWARMLGERLHGALTVDLTGVDAPVPESAAKRALYRATGA